MPKLGRPKLAPQERKSKVAFMRVREDEMKLLKQAGKVSGMQYHEWMRSEIIPAAKRLVGKTASK